MAKLELLLEAEKRGILDNKNKSLLTEARNRGLLTASGEQVPIPEPKTQEERIEIGKPIGKRKFLEEAPETIGGIVGGIGGGVLGKTPSSVRAGTVVGSGVGGAVGKAASQFFSGEDLDATEIAKSGAKQAVFELGGQALIGVGQKVLAPFTKRLTPEGILAKETLDKFVPKGEVSVLPAEMTESRTLDILQNVSEKSLFGGKGIADLKNISRPKAINSMIDDLTSKFGASVEPDALGEAVEQIVSGNLKTSRFPATVMYNNVDSLVASKGDFISTKSLKQFAQPLLTKSEQLGGIGGANSGDDIIKGVMDLPDSISYSTAQDLRSRLIAKADEFSVANKKAPAIGKSKKLASLTDDAINEGLKRENPQALSLWRDANKVWQSTGEQYNNKFIRQLINEAKTKNNPELIAEKIFKPRGVSNIRKIKKAVDPATFQQLKRWHVDSLLKKSVDTEGKLVGNSFHNNMFGKSGMGEQTMKEIYSPVELQSLKESSNALKVIQQRQGEETGSMWIQLAQPTAIVGLFNDASQPISIAVLGAPEVVSRIMLNPRGAKWLTTGAKLPKGSAQATSIVTKLGELATRLRKENDIPYKTPNLQELEGQSTLGE